jgi:hypothetical protein
VTWAQQQLLLLLLDLDARRRAVEAERGLAFNLSCWLNYRTLPTGRPRPS